MMFRVWAYYGSNGRELKRPRDLGACEVDMVNGRLVALEPGSYPVRCLVRLWRARVESIAAARILVIGFEGPTETEGRYQEIGLCPIHEADA